MLRITQHDARGRTTLRLAGRLTAPWIEEFERVTNEGLARGAPVRLELAELTYLDDAGVAALGRLVDAGVAWTGASPFVRELLKRSRNGQPDRSDAELVARLRARDPRASEELVRSYGARLLATARRVLEDGDEEGALRAVRTAFQDAFASIERLPRDVRLWTWLRRHALRAALAEPRARAPRCGTIEELLPAFDAHGNWTRPSPTVSCAAEATPETAERVRAAIARLSPECRVVLVLRDVEELGLEELAEVLALPAALVKERLHRARMALCALLGERPRTPDAARAAS